MGDGAGRPSVGRRPASPRAVLAVVGFAVFVAADDLTVVATMLRPIIGDLGLTLPDGLDEAAWIVNAYLIAFVAVMPIAGRISDIVGRRRTFLAAYSLFIVGTIIIPTLDVTRTVPVRPRADGPRRRGDGACGAGGGRRCVSGSPGGPLAYSVRSRRSAGCGVRCTARCSCGSSSWQWQFWLNVPLAVVGWPPHGSCWPTTIGRSARHASTGSVACWSRCSWSR